MKNIITRIKSFFKQTSEVIGKRPFASFLVALAVFVGLMAASHAINTPKTESTKTEKPPIQVSTYHIGTSPKVQIQANLKKEGVITLQAQTSGIVQQINKTEGEKVSKGTQILWISSNYNGGTISTTQRQLAQTSYNNAQTTIQLNKDAIANQRDLADRNRDNTEELRKISDKAVADTRNILNLNNELLRNLDQQINDLQANNSRTPEQEAQLSALKGQKAQLASSETQLNASLRANEYTADPNKQPTAIANIQRDLTFKQLAIQEKSLDLQLEVSRLTYLTAQISEAFNYPSSPFAGTIERIHVTPGQLVNPGEPLVTLTSTNNQATAEGYIPQQIAKQVSKTSPSLIYIDNKPIEVLPTYISTQPTNGSLYSIKYQIPSEYADKAVNNTYTKIEISVGTPDTTGSVPFIPLDSIYQTQDGAYVYTAESADQNKTVAKTKKVQLGQIIGNYVEVISGLSDKDIVIIDRNVLEGDQITTREQALMEGVR